MGLACGPHGVKTFVKQTFPNCLRDFPTLASCVQATGHQTKQVVAILDGNVLVNQLPMSVTTFDGYVSVFSGFLRQAFQAADAVFVVWDEPCLVTKAKLEEQRKRDQARKKSVPMMSADLAATLAPDTDSYGIDVIESCNPHDLLANRAARPRFWDALCKRSMCMMSERPMAGKVLLFDGIDCRGADRPHTEKREPGMFSNDDKIETLMERPSTHVFGEGDLKLTDLEGEIQDLRNSGKAFTTVELVLVCTIDTDSIAIELMQEAVKVAAAAASEDQESDAGKHLKTVLCFRETNRKRKEGDDEPAHSVSMHACIDLQILYNEIVADLNIDGGLGKPAIALLVAGWAMCGCDFVHLKGIRSDVVWSSMKLLCKREKSILERMDPIYSLSSTDDDEAFAHGRRLVTSAISRLAELCIDELADMPRMQKACASAREVLGPLSKFAMACQPPCAEVLKAAWTTLYWSGLERTDLRQWGFDI